MARFRFRSLYLVSTGVTLAAIAIACGNAGSEFTDPSTSTGDDGSASNNNTFGSELDATSGDATNNNGPALPIRIEPATATLAVTSTGAHLTQGFTLMVGNPGSEVATTPSGWTLDKYAAGDIATNGTFTTSGSVSGKVKVTAHYQGRTATADLTVTMSVSEDVPGGVINGANRTALNGTPAADPGGGNATKVLYPLDGTVFPRGLNAPVLQFSPGTIVPQDVKVTLSCSTFTWTGYAHVSNGATPQVQIPDAAWDSALQSCGGEAVTVSLVKSASGSAYGPATISFIAAPTTLKGVVYYQSYTNLGLWSVKPGVKAPAIHLKTDCNVCHSVSANGSVLTVGADWSQSSGPVVAQSGAYKTDPDGGITQISAAPSSPALGNNGGDSRQLSWATLTPDGSYVLRAHRDFWGGQNMRAFKVDKNGDAGTQMGEATVNGLASIAAYVPSFSPDGKKLVFVTGDESADAGLGSPRHAINTMDFSVNPDAGANGTLSFSNATRQLDTTTADGGASRITKFPAFLPDSQQIVLQEGTNSGGCDGYGGMLGYYGCATGKLFLLRGGEHIELAKLNKGVVASDETRSYGPTVLPVQAGGYFWVVFTSNREYGNTYTGGNAQKQLWVAAIDPSSPAGVDPSHAAFFLPNQSNSHNERGYWALEPCRAEGSGCTSGDECCDGYCRPEDSSVPNSSLVCKKPVVGQCAQAAEKCTVTADCCDSSNQCIGGFCTPPVPNPTPR